MSSSGLVEHFFRHEYGRLVATLTRRFGVARLDAIEDAVQSALMAALETWPRNGEPEQPSAWLFRVAHRRLLDELRGAARRGQLLERHAPTPDPAEPQEPYLPGEVPSDLLQMLFRCCDDAIPAESQLVLALKTLCGFDVDEIAERLFTTRANVYKRLSRARQRLATEASSELGDLTARRPAVQRVLYLLFTEGYLSSQAATAIRRELCREAIRLTTILAEHPLGEEPTTRALLALMHLHAARITSRQDGSGGLVLLQDQDRDLWDRRQIELGLWWLAQSAEGDVFSRYHAEAGIAAEHCLAPSFAETRWERVVACYALLEREAPSALHRLNRAIATAEWQGPEAGLAVLEDAAPPTWLEGSYLWAAALADLHRRARHPDEAARYRTLALEGAPSSAVRELLERRLAQPLRGL